jgi:hypothetical protein
LGDFNAGFSQKSSPKNFKKPIDFGGDIFETVSSKTP